MDVLLVDHNENAVQAQAAALQGSGCDVATRVVDVRDPVAVDATAAWAFARWGTVRLLVNNAGTEVHGQSWTLSVEQWQQVLDVNLNGIFFGLRSFIPRMAARGERSHILNISSVAALSTSAHTAPYGVTKHGVLALTDAVALELAAANSCITISVALPGAVRTAIFKHAQVASDDGLAEDHRRKMLELVENDGMSTDAAADRIFDGLHDSRLRIHTDPAMSKSFIETRWRALLDSTD